MAAEGTTREAIAAKDRGGERLQGAQRGPVGLVGGLTGTC